MANTTTLILISSILSLLAAIAAITVTAIRKRRQARHSSISRAVWRPPVGSGLKIMLWGAKVSELVTRKILAGRRTKATANNLAQEMLAGASFAIQHLPHVDKDIDVTDCRSRVFHRIGVTPPEILAVADEIRRDPKEAQRIHDLAAINADLLTRHPGTEMHTSLVCPLRTNEGNCTARHLCPLHCRTSCSLTSGLEPADAAVVQQVASDLGFGIEVGVSRGLQFGGLDGHVYELNSALATALETRDASEKWARGEYVFERCMRDDFSAYSI
jgi:hypothetical protein